MSHSVLDDIQTIEQENVPVTTNTTLSNLGKLRLSETESFFDDFGYASSFSMNRNVSNSFGASKLADTLYGDNTSAKDNWVIVDDPAVDRAKKTPKPGRYIQF